jgi:hypothetical protein
LYPTLATLPHLDLDCPVRLAVMGAPEVGKSALAVRYLSGQQQTTVVENKTGKPTFQSIRFYLIFTHQFYEAILFYFYLLFS